jgi:hypothetical protein
MPGPDAVRALARPEQADTCAQLKEADILTHKKEKT